jgi:dihydroorotase
VILKNAAWLAPDGVFRNGSIILRSGTIDHLSPASTTVSHEGPSLDCAGLLVLPGLIDAHVHLREPGQEYKEGIANGSLAAAVGGVTTLLDMPNNKPPCSTDEIMQLKRELFRAKCITNWGLHVEATADGTRISDSAIASAKIYMARSSSNPALCTVPLLTQVFERYHRVSIHAEDETLFFPAETSRDLSAGRHSAEHKRTREPGEEAATRPLFHHEARPRVSIRSALVKVEEAYESLPKEIRPRLILCHIATVDELEWVRSMKGRGHDIYAETCPHYWTFTANDYVERGTVLKVNPPLRSCEDRAGIREALAKDGIDFVSTDHAPHTRAEKADPTSLPSGIAAVEWLMPLLLQLVDQGTIDWRRFIQLGCENAAHCYGITGRDGIREGSSGDLVLVEETPFRRVSTVPTVTKAGVNPYSQHRFRYRVFATVVNGVIVQKNGLLINRSAGEEVYR